MKKFATVWFGLIIITLVLWIPVHLISNDSIDSVQEASIETIFYETIPERNFNKFLSGLEDRGVDVSYELEDVLDDIEGVSNVTYSTSESVRQRHPRYKEVELQVVTVSFDYNPPYIFKADPETGMMQVETVETVEGTTYELSFLVADKSFVPPVPSAVIAPLSVKSLNHYTEDPAGMGNFYAYLFGEKPKLLTTF